MANKLITLALLSQYDLKAQERILAQLAALKTEIVGEVGTIKLQAVDSLPETGVENVIYLVPNVVSGEKNIKDEYVWVSGAWEKIGTTELDLSGYALKSDVEELSTTVGEVQEAVEGIQSAYRKVDDGAFGSVAVSGDSAEFTSLAATTVTGVSTLNGTDITKGVATLGEDGKVLSTLLPELTYATAEDIDALFVTD